MTFLDAFWHVLNFFAPAAGVGTLAAGLSKGLWRRELAGVRWRSLAAWGVAASAAASLVSLLLLGRDGRIGGYAAMVGSCALALWWRGFMRR